MKRNKTGLFFTKGEERANAISHGVGAAFGLMAGAWLLHMAYAGGNRLAVAGVWLYVAGMMGSYVSSTLTTVCAITIHGVPACDSGTTPPSIGTLPAAIPPSRSPSFSNRMAGASDFSLSSGLVQPSERPPVSAVWKNIAISKLYVSC